MRRERKIKILAPLRGAPLFLICSGGFRFASTTGYYLAALRAETRILVFIDFHATVFRLSSPDFRNLAVSQKTLLLN
jgi:hypothetical protein